MLQSLDLRENEPAPEPVLEPESEPELQPQPPPPPLRRAMFGVPTPEERAETQAMLQREFQEMADRSRARLAQFEVVGVISPQPPQPPAQHVEPPSDQQG